MSAYGRAEELRRAVLCKFGPLGTPSGKRGLTEGE